MEKTKVFQFLNKNQFVLETTGDNGLISRTFQSYDSICAVMNYKDKTLTLGQDYDYSQTTRRHLYAFIDEYCDRVIPELQAVKQSKNKGALIRRLINDHVIIYAGWLK